MNLDILLLQWFNDVHSIDISDMCEDVLDQLSKIHGCEVRSLSISDASYLRNILFGYGMCIFSC